MDFTYGDVITFTKDLTKVYPHKNCRPGVHYLFIAVSDSGYTFDAFDTFAQRREIFMAESWLTKHIRRIGNVTTVPADEDAEVAA